jgi:hypothetical protein
MKILIRWLYRLFPGKFREVFVEEFMLDVPRHVSDPAFEILSDNKRTLQRYFTYQGWLWARKNAHNLKHSDFTLGVLTAIKSFMILMEVPSLSARGKEKGEKTDSPSFGQNTSTLAKDLAGVEKFRQAKLSTEE